MPAKKKTETVKKESDVEEKSHIVSEPSEPVAADPKPETPEVVAPPSESTLPQTSEVKTEPTPETATVTDAAGMNPVPPTDPPIASPNMPTETSSVVVNSSSDQTMPVTVGSDGSGRKKIMTIVVVALLVLGLATGLYFLYANFLNKSDEPATETVTEETAPAPAAEAPVEESIDLTAFPIKVLNGTEKSGEAGKLKTNLEEEGFVVASVGNHSTSDVELTEVSADPTVNQKFVDRLTEFLAKSFKMASESGKIASGSSDKVVVVIGSEVAP